MNITRMVTLEAHGVQSYVWTKSIPLVPFGHWNSLERCFSRLYIIIHIGLPALRVSYVSRSCSSIGQPNSFEVQVDSCHKRVRNRWSVFLILFHSRQLSSFVSNSCLTIYIWNLHRIIVCRWNLQRLKLMQAKKEY